MREGVQGKVVLLTGGCMDLGAETARYLAFRGARIAIAARNTHKLAAVVAQIASEGGEARAYRLDVASQDQVKRVVDEVLVDFGGLNVVVNCAGLMNPFRRMVERHVDEWDATIDVNLKGVLHGIAAALPVFLHQGYGHIINLTAAPGVRLCAQGDTVCSGVKFAIRAITEGLRQEVAGRVRVTCIQTGAVERERKFRVLESEPAGIADFRRTAVPASSVARAVAYAIEQPPDIDINEIVLRTAEAVRPSCSTKALMQQGETSWVKI